MIRPAALVACLTLALCPLGARAADRLSFLHVGAAPGAPADLPQVLDRADRSVLLRGVNINGLEDYYSNSATPTAVAYPTDPAAYAGGSCPARNKTVESIAVCDFDAGQLRSFGYDVVRLAVSWSLLEPAPGQISQTYIDRIAQVVGWLRSAGIYAVIDMHQDAWSKYLYTGAGQNCPAPLSPVTGAHEADGAPDWASVHATPVCQLSVRELDPAVAEDFQRLWSNTPATDGVGLQDHFARAMAALASRFRNDPAVAGYDIFNEPSPGLLAPPAADSAQIFPFYAKVIRTVRNTVPGFRQLFFIEPDVLRDVTDQRYALLPWSTYSDYGNVVYAPHIYTHVFTPDALASAPSLGPLFTVDSGYAGAAADARALAVPLWDGEFGIGVEDDETTLRQHYDTQDRLGVGGVLWVWKADGFSVMHGPFGQGTPFPSRVKFTDRAYPLYTAGILKSLAYDPNRATFDMRATSAAVTPGNDAHETLIYVPARSGGAVRATGAAVTVTALADGAREAHVYPHGGRYHVFQEPAARAGLPAGGGRAVGPCASRRRLVIHLRARRAQRLRGARAYVGRRLVGRTRPGSRTLVVDLRGLQRGPVRVRIVETVQTARGVRHVTIIRRYRTCRPGR